MSKLAVVPDRDRNLIVVQPFDDAGSPAPSIGLTPEMLAQTFANLLAAYGVMNKNVGMPGEPGTWTDTPAIESPAWKVGARPLDGAVTLSVCPAKVGDQELWLTYAFQRSQAIKLYEVLGQALARPTFAGSA